jgi:glycosyltransferase involved in cell wall biosynthesis
MAMGMDLSVVIPIKDERDNLRPLHDRLGQTLVPLGLPYEILFVDDGSTDGSFEVLSELAARDERVKVVQLRRNYGQSPALAAGIAAATGEIIITMDGDLQNDPADIPQLLEQIEAGHDVVLGWRRERQDGWWHRRLPSLLANRLIRWVTRVPIQDMGCTLRAMRRQAAGELSLYGEMHRFIPVLAQHGGHRLRQIPVRHHPRRFGRTKYNLTRTVRVLLDLITVKFWQSYLTRPMHLFGFSGLGCVLGSLFSLSITLGEKVWRDQDMTGNPLLLLSVLLLVVGIQFLSLGLIGEVLSRTYFESQGKTPYQIRTTLNVAPAAESKLEGTTRQAA